MEDQITQYIQNILQREPAPGEVDGWIAIIEGNVATLEEVRQMIIDTAEAVTNVYPMVLTYQAIYGRVPDADGLEYWTNVYASNLGLDDPATTTVNEALVEVLKPFVDPAQTPEFIDRYGANPTGDQFVAAAYQNVLNRVPDQDGLTYWQTRYAQIEASYADSGMTQDEITVQVRAEILEQFVNSAEYKTATAEEVDAYLTARAEGEDVSGSLWDLDPDANVGQTFTLTEGTDIMPGLIGSKGTTDTDGDDTIIAGLSNAGGFLDNNLGSGDVINGGLGFDTLQIIDEDSSLLPNMVGVERVNIQALGNNDTDVDFTNASGVEQIWNYRSTDDVDIENIQDDAVLGFFDTNTTMDADYAEDALADGAIDVEIINSDAELYVDTNENAVVVDTINVNVTGKEASALDIEVSNDSTPTNLNISGDAEFYIEGDALHDVQNVTITNTGDTTVNFDGLFGAGNTEDLTVQGGPGNDTFIIDRNGLDENDSFNGGDGDDALVVRFRGNADLTLAGAHESVIDAANNSDIETLVVDVYTTAGNEGNEGIVLEADEFETLHNFVFQDSLSIGGGNDTELDGDITVTGVENEDTFRFAVGSAETDGVVSFTAATGADTLNVITEGDFENGFTASGFETVNIELDNAGDTGDDNIDIDGLTVDADATVYLTGETATVEVYGFEGGNATIDASQLVTQGDRAIDANVIEAGVGSQNIIGTAQDDILTGDTLIEGVAQEHTVTIGGAVEEGDTYTLTVDGIEVEYVAADGDTVNDVEAGLADAINANVDLIAAGITADASGADLVITGNPDGTPFEVEGDATDAVATAQRSVIDLGEDGFDEGDTIAFTITPDGGAPVAFNIAVPIGGWSPAVAAANVTAAIAGNLVLIGAGLSAQVTDGTTVTVTGNPDGTDFAVTLQGTGGEGVTEALPVADAELIGFNAPSAPGDLFVFTIAGIEVEMLSQASTAASANALINLINDNEDLSDLGISAAPGANTWQVVVTDPSGNNLDITVDHTGTGTAPTIVGGPAAQTSVGVPVTDNAISVEEVQEGIEAGSDDNGPEDFTIVVTEEGVLEVGAASDTYTGGTGADSFVVQTVDIDGLGIVAAQAAADIITDFSIVEGDLINFEITNVAGTDDNYAEGPVNGHGNFNGALAQAQSDFADHIDLIYSAQQVGADVYIFAREVDDLGVPTGDTADQVVQLVGITLDDLSNDGSFIGGLIV